MAENLSDADKADICALYRQAKNKHEQIKINAQLYAVREEDVRAVLLVHGYSLPKKSQRSYRGAPLPPEVEAERLRLYEAGMTYRQIANALGVGYATIRSWAQSRHLPNMARIRYPAERGARRREAYGCNTNEGGQ